MKIAIIYQVVFHYRMPLYEYISNSIKYESVLFYGKNSKIGKSINAKGPYNFVSKKLKTYRLPINMGHGQAEMPFFPFLFFQLIRYNPKVIISEGISGLPNTLQAFLYAKLFRKKFIWWGLGRLENREYKGFRKHLEFFIRFLERRSDAIITYSTEGEKFYENIGITKNKIFKAINVVDTNKRLKEISLISDKVAKDDNVFQILFVGVIIPEKKLEVLLDAFKMLEDKYGDRIKLLIIGSGNYLDTIKKYSEKLELKNIEFKGKVIDGISKYFLESDVFVLPNLGGLAISDSMIHGLPVIASKADGTEKDLISDDCGVLDADLNSSKLFLYLEDFILDKEKLKKMGIIAKLRMTSTFSYNNYLEMFDKAINKVIK